MNRIAPFILTFVILLNLPAVAQGPDTPQGYDGAPSLRGLGNEQSTPGQIVPIEQSSVDIKPKTGKKHNHSAAGAVVGLPDRTAKAAVGMTHRTAKTEIGMVDRTAKTAVGLSDRATKTVVGLPFKAAKETLKMFF